MQGTSSPVAGPNCVLIPDPSKTAYLEAHSLIDQVPEDCIWAIVHVLRREVERKCDVHWESLARDELAGLQSLGRQVRPPSWARPTIGNKIRIYDLGVMRALRP